MIRWLIWLFVGYMVWKIIEIILASRRRPRPHDKGFSDIEEAKFEDVTPKSPPSDQKSS